MAPSSDRYRIHYGYAWVAVLDTARDAYVFSASCPHDELASNILDAAEQIAMWLAVPEFDPPLDPRMDTRPFVVKAVSKEC